MTLDELDEKLEKAEKKVYPIVETHTNPREGWSEGHGDWIKRRMAEDAVLQFNKCPTCACDVGLEIINGVRYFKCTKHKEHQFTRWAGLMVNQRLINEYDGERYWE